MRCPDAQALLAAYVDHVLSLTEREQVEAHVSACDVCRAELESWTEALGGLEAAAPQDAPDLWSRFQARVQVDAAPLACAEALKLVPGSRDALLTPREAADLEGHLAACAPCRTEEERLAQAVLVLEAVAASMRAPDLWPAFVARLERELARQPAWRGWLAAVHGWVVPERNAWTRPALAAGALVLAALLLRGVQHDAQINRSTPGPVAQVPTPTLPRAVVPTPADKRTVEHSPETPILSRKDRMADASNIQRVEHPHVRRRHRLRATAVRVARRGREQAPEVSAPPVRVHAPTRVAMTHPVESPREVPAVDWQPGVAPEEMGTVQEAAQAEVVHAVAMLAGLEDTARRPFEMNADEH